MTAGYYYTAVFALSLVLSIIFAYRWHRHFDIYFTLIFTLIPLVNLGYVMRFLAKTLDSAIMAQKIVYLGGCYLIFFITLCVFRLCGIPIRRLGSTLTLTAVSAVYGLVFTIGYYPVFYKEVSFKITEGQGILLRRYGPGHTVFYLMVITLFCVSFAVIAYSYFFRNQVSRKILMLLFIPEAVSFFCFFGGRLIQDKIELVPASYAFAQIMYLSIVHRICLYNVSETVIDSILEAEDAGFVNMDFDWNYLGSTSTAQRILPHILQLTVDRPAADDEWIAQNFLPRLREFEQEGKDTFYFRKEGNERIYQGTIQYLYDDKNKRGYQFVIRDDTKNQEYISLINHYNADLEAQVRRKTQNLVDMHNKLILGMATMVESRDNSTGGHIRRTSEGVRILVRELHSSGSYGFSDRFCENLIKAAPMHDLGKIAVDDAILRKPGRFTEEEFDQMKKHAGEGARIVHEILKDTEDEEFRLLAENVAHYHHERWDGSGYPEGLCGARIPIEARIMAVADVYDALVSKRVYKDAMSFEQADAIIMDGMGKQFDPDIREFYLLARPKLEAFYGEQT